MKKTRKMDWRAIAHNDKGRSMLEMLSVLAVIGVLSIAGVGGYRMAINKHKANQIIYDVGLGQAELRSMEVFTSETEIAVPFTPSSGLDTFLWRDDNANDLVLVNAISKPVCERLKDMVGNDGLKIFKTEDGAELDTCTDNIDLMFTFDNAPSGSGAGGEETPVVDLCDGVVCQNGGYCNKGNCVCTSNYTGANCQTGKDCTAAVGYTAPTCSTSCCTLTGDDDLCGNPTPVLGTTSLSTYLVLNENGCCVETSATSCSLNPTTARTCTPTCTGICEDEECAAAGVIVTASTGATFYQSKKTMARDDISTWCKNNGMTLASMYDLCPDWDGTTGYGKYPTTFSGNISPASVFTSTPASNSDSFFYTSLSGGYVGIMGGNWSGFRAICK